MLFKSFHGVFLTHFWNQYEGIAPFYVFLRQAKRLAKKPFDAVSLYAFAVFFANGNPHRRPFRRAIKKGERRRREPLSFLEEPLKVRLFFQSQIFHICRLLFPSFSLFPHVFFVGFPTRAHPRFLIRLRHKGWLIFAKNYFSDLRGRIPSVVCN